uniref:G_PROTEIN_RECEP_F1_2 domain-containing protein n=1 Tax=Steinernema glaseri TaxID=37863 RepID=A0A1I7YHV9_9BILA
MLIEVAIAEFVIVIILCLITITTLLLSLRIKPVKTVWKQCPPLCLVILSNGVLAAVCACHALQWILFDFGYIKNVAENGFFLTLFNRTVTIIQQLSNCCELGLFAQRIFYVLYPVGKLRNFYLIATLTLSMVFLILCISPVYSIIGSAAISGRPVPEGCFAFSCMVSTNGTTLFGITVRVLQSSSTAVVAAVSTCLGTIMLFLSKKLAKNNISILEKEKGRFSRYVFLVHLCNQTVPSCLDSILSVTAHFSIGSYIGPYGVLGASLSVTIETVVYYSMLRTQKTRVALTSTT